jgi:hypothetical protein
VAPFHGACCVGVLPRPTPSLRLALQVLSPLVPVAAPSVSFTAAGTAPVSGTAADVIGSFTVTWAPGAPRGCAITQYEVVVTPVGHGDTGDAADVVVVAAGTACQMVVPVHRAAPAKALPTESPPGARGEVEARAASIAAPTVLVAGVSYILRVRCTSAVSSMVHTATARGCLRGCLRVDACVGAWVDAYVDAWCARLRLRLRATLLTGGTQ